MKRLLPRLIGKLRRMFPVPGSAIRRMRGGYDMLLYPQADSLELRMFSDRTYEAATLALFDAVLRHGDTMVDVGANIGLMTIHAARLVGSAGAIVALEPHPVYFRRLVDNINRNSLNNVDARQLAAGSGPGFRELFDVPSINIGRSTLILPSEDFQSAGLVSVRRLDDILEGLRLERIRMLKIDVEGFEAEVIRGAEATLAKEPLICMELSDAIPSGENNPLAANDLVMSSGLYAGYTFAHGKADASPLVPIVDRSQLEKLRHANVVYIPLSKTGMLPDRLFR
jgi:FkbM family methyltransferase